MDTITRMRAPVEVVEAGGFSVIVREDVQAGRLVTLLEAFEPDDLGIYAVYPHRERMPPKLRAFVDHLAAWYEAERKAGRSC